MIIIFGGVFCEKVTGAQAQMIKSKARSLNQTGVPFQRCTKASTPEEDSSCFLIAVAFVRTLKMFSHRVFINAFGVKLTKVLRSRLPRETPTQTKMLRVIFSAVNKIRDIFKKEQEIHVGLYK